ncbi:DUF3568 family protein [Francisella frigiditurris]|uniref:Lipoprotein n=1 Tax=Francisella frigiditurris TaxID=1542390 RepID=A0A1J0KVG8_9GAMM|nr:DUF3568 family protein [Francisella frigiditurris]APC97691.1 hypothetical protein KX01_459 [Francisella frigiditurris]
MNISKMIYIAILSFFLFLSGCATTDQANATYEQGNYTVNMDSSMKQVYDATLRAVETGQTYDDTGNPYIISINKINDKSALIKAQSGADPSDYLYVAFGKKTNDSSIIRIRYGQDGDEIRSSALIPIIKKNLNNFNVDKINIEPAL